MKVSGEVSNVYKDFLKPYAAQNPQGQEVFVMDLSEKQNKAKGKKAKTAIISLSVVALITLMTFFGKSKVSGYSRKLADIMEKGLQDRASNTNNIKVRAGIEKVARGFSKAREFLNTWPNIVNGKDTLNKKIINLDIPGFGLLRKFDEKTSKLYERLCRSTLSSTYQKAKKGFSQAGTLIEAKLAAAEINFKGNPEKLKQVERARELMRLRNGSVDELIGQQAERFARINRIMLDGESKALKGKSLSQEVCDQMVGNIKNKEPGRFKKFFTHFFSREILKDDKAAIQRGLMSSKNAISRNADSVVGDLGENMKKIRPLLNDAKSWEACVELEKALKLQNGGLSEDKIRKAVKGLEEAIQTGQYKDSDKIKELLGAMTDILSSNKKGYTEELKDILVNLFGKDAYDKELRGVTRGAVKNLTKAVKFEGDDLFDKVRDIKIGSAPTDFYTLFMATGGMGIYLAQADTKEERTSVSLTKGVPILMTILMSMYTAAKGITAVKGLGYSAISGILANKIGKEISKEYLKKHEVDEKDFTLPNFDEIITLPTFLEETHTEPQAL